MTAAAPNPSFLGALKNIGRGVYRATAKFAGYQAALATTTTQPGSRIGTNPNSVFADMQRKAMGFTAEHCAKNSAIGAAYLGLRQNYCSSLLTYIPATGDTGLDAEIASYLHGADGHGGFFATMGMDCSMQDAFQRTADLEVPVHGDAGLIFWRDESGDLRIIEFSADQLGGVNQYIPLHYCSLARMPDGELREVSGSDCVYFSGRYMRGADAVAYKIFERTDSWYGNARIYAAADVLYFRDPSSFRGLRGVTLFANALQHMQKGEDMLQAALSAAQRQARTAGFVFNNSGGPNELDMESSETGDGRVRYFEREPSGPMTEFFYNGDSAQFTSPNTPGPEIIQGVETADERVAIALRMNYAFLISATKVGGAPSRLEINKAAKEIGRIKKQIHIPKLNRIRDVVLLDALQRGIIRKPYGMDKKKFLSGYWMTPISPSVDAFYDAQENIKMKREGLESAKDIIAETNRDWRIVLSDNGEWAEACAIEVEKRNKNLVAKGFKPTITAADVAQISDNPAQSAQAEQIVEVEAAIRKNGNGKIPESRLAL